ncbi:hypothetical protein [Haladaptatus sp. DFWS20]|uniref:hypothetical protein n=1 Tax=Haladaptatus sp. DFWS20 TaxID=3403467 RepID=UPI003EBA5355
MTPSTNRPTIGLAYWPDSGNAAKRELLDRLRSWATLVVFDPSVEHHDLHELGLDFYHMASWHPRALADLKRARDAGIPTVNSDEGARATADRLNCYRTLRHGKVLVPEYQYGRARDITIFPPAIIKPRNEFDARGHDFAVHLAGAYDFPDEQIVQKYVVPHRSYKLFGIGDEVRAVKLPRDGSTPVEQQMTPSLARYVKHVEVLFDLVLFELDVLVHKSIYVIDVNPAVNLDGISDGPALYEELIRRKVGGEFPTIGERP